ncbi:MAG TPA: outer membrane beta-barrel family protein [Flavitalea sp.]|nr:outer membrane beta-barrel family protein [Flavitalea sp.]
MRFLILAFSLTCLSLFAVSQTNSKISGIVLDSGTRDPIDYASISLINLKTGKTTSGSVSDASGSFVLNNFAPGLYRLSVEFVGYLPYIKDSVNIKDDISAISLGTILLTPSAQQLQGVTVTGRAPVLENKIDKIVFNVANDITSQGGVALDVLKKVPQVTIDIDGNVELQGNNNIRFLINGKPSSMFGSSLVDALSSIPASQIKSIEAITSPGAKYDAQGTGGIINIILKDNKAKGINGTINLSAGTRLENGSLNINYRKDKLGINAFFNGNAQLRSVTLSSQDRMTTDTIAKSLTRLVQDNRTEFVRSGFQTGIGFDYSISKQDEFSGNVSINHFKNHNDGFTGQRELSTDFSGNPLDETNTERISSTRFKMISYDWALAYKHKFHNEGQELSITYNASQSTPYSEYTQLQNYAGTKDPFSGRTSTNPGKDSETEIAIDYTHPLAKDFLFETGVKMIQQDISSSSLVGLYDPVTSQFSTDPKQSYRLGYSMKVYGGYVSGTFSVSDWLNVKAGARYEYTNASIDFPNTKIPSYGNFVPSVIFSHNLTKEQSIKLAYSYRIERPEYRELNPFLNISDPYNISTGNPLLKPEIGNNFELGYSKSFPAGGSVYLSLIERINTQDIKNITIFYPEFTIGDSVYNNVSLSNIQNIGTEYNSGISISGSVPVREKFNLRSNLQLSQRNIVSELKTGNSNMGLRFRVNLNASYQLPKNLVIEAFGNYNSSSRSIQGKTPQSITYTIAGRKQFWNKKASIGLTATNPFNKYVNQLTTIQTDNSTSTAIRSIPYQSFGISLSYKFGKLEFKKDKSNENNNDNNTLPSFGG